MLQVVVWGLDWVIINFLGFGYFVSVISYQVYVFGLMNIVYVKISVMLCKCMGSGGGGGM